MSNEKRTIISLKKGDGASKPAQNKPDQPTQENNYIKEEGKLSLMRRKSVVIEHKLNLAPKLPVPPINKPDRYHTTPRPIGDRPRPPGSNPIPKPFGDTTGYRPYNRDTLNLAQAPRRPFGERTGIQLATTPRAPHSGHSSFVPRHRPYDFARTAPPYPRPASKGPAKPKQHIVRHATIGETISVVDLAYQLAIQANKLCFKLKDLLGVHVKSQDSIDGDTAALIAEELGHKVTRVSDAKDELVRSKSNLVPRAPIITIAGHVDHGKTTTLDTIRNTSVASSEVGGITQSIGAYQVTRNDRLITFVDTPGHLAFTKMRARGIALTDIAILIVAADSSIQEQTVESIKHIQKFNTPMIVAINKCDVYGANPKKIKQDLLQHGIIIEELGGDVPAVEISAKTGHNIDKLLDTIIFQADILDLKASATDSPIGIVLEAEMVKGLGPVISVILNQGTLKIGDVFIVGQTFGKVRKITNDKGESLKEAIVSQPVRISGLDALPQAGDELGSVKNEAEARDLLRDRSAQPEDTKEPVNLLSLLNQKSFRTHKFVINANTYGALESLKYMLEALSSETDKVEVIQESIGDLSVTDVEFANTAKARIILFHTQITPAARALIQNYKTDVSQHKIIYRVVEEVQDVISKISMQEEQETPVAEGEVIKIFDVQNVGCIIGSRITSGAVKIGEEVAFFRKNQMIYRGVVTSIQQAHSSVPMAEMGNEYGFIVKKNNVIYKNASTKDKLKFYKPSGIESK